MSTNGVPGHSSPRREHPDQIGFSDDESVYGDRRWRAAAFHQMPYMVAIFHGPRHVNVGENPVTVQMFGGHNLGRAFAEYAAGGGQGLLELFDRAYAGETVVMRAVRTVVVTPQGAEVEVFADAEYSPLRGADGTVVGVVVFARDVTDQVRAERERAFAAAELTRRYRRATDVVEEVQRALLPSRLPVLPGVRLAASYVVGGAEQAAGGDWFDVLPRPGGQVAAVVGDVVGHGVGASAVMAQLRAVALERLHAGATPAQVVAALDRFTQVVPAAASATVCVLVLNPSEGTVQHCSAGHPPPLVVDPRGTSRFLAPSGATPLHDPSQDREERVEQRTVLDTGEMVLLYTDGIVERPGVPATTGTVELAQTAAAAAADDLMPVFTLPTAAERVAVQTLERLTRFTGSSDDITLLALHPVATLADLHERITLGRGDIPGVRARLRQWLGARQVAAQAADQLDEIVSELCENVVEHAYGSTVDAVRGSTQDGVGPVEVRAHLDELGTITMTIRDQGLWRPPPQPAPGRGLGLAIVRELADDLRVNPSPHGTHITTTFTAWTIPHGATAQPPRQEPGTFDVYTEDRDDGSITTVRGPVDAVNVSSLDSELALRTVPGAAPLTVHLGQVSVLCSAAVHVLRRRLEEASAAGVEVHLVSGPGTIADHVLALVGITTNSASS